MAKIWDFENKVKYEPADVDRWSIREPGETDYHNKGRKSLTQWQVEAVFCKKAALDVANYESGQEVIEIVNVGYYDSHQEAVEAVDELDAMKKAELSEEVIEFLKGSDSWGKVKFSAIADPRGEGKCIAILRDESA